MPVSNTIIFGAGGHARVVLDLLICKGVSVFGLIDDSPTCGALDGFPVFDANGSVWSKLDGFRFVVAVGANQVRASIFDRLLNRGGTPLTVLHPNAVVSRHASIGLGTVAMAGVIVNSGAEVGANCILNTGCSVDHDCRLGDHIHLCPGVRLAGRVCIGAQSMLGTSCCVVPGTNIGSGTLVGAGAVVIRDLPDFCCAYGNPARVRPLK